MANDKEIVIGRAVDLATGRQGVVVRRVIQREHTVAEELRRNAISMLRSIVRAYPKEAKEVVRELVSE